MNLDAQWIVGFVDGEGCFHVGMARHSSMTTGIQVLPEFTVVQHKRDVKILHALKSFFGCGAVRVNHRDHLCWRVRRFDHLREIVVPFFEKHSLKTMKRQDFVSFRKVIRWMQEDRHLSHEGIEQIREVVGRMNRRRGIMEKDL